MTREEAIKWVTFDLESWEHQCLSYHPTKEALEMAIEALAQPEVIRCKYCKYAKSVDSESWIRCDLSGSYELREWYCGSARRREE